jgi:hypothetical protein
MQILLAIKLVAVFIDTDASIQHLPLPNHKRIPA